MWRRAKRIEGGGLNASASLRNPAQKIATEGAGAGKRARMTTVRAILIQTGLVALANAGLFVLAMTFEPGLLPMLPFFAIFSFLLIVALAAMAIKRAGQHDELWETPVPAPPPHYAEGQNLDDLLRDIGKILEASSPEKRTTGATTDGVTIYSVTESWSEPLPPKNGN